MKRQLPSKSLILCTLLIAYPIVTDLMSRNELLAWTMMIISACYAALSFLVGETTRLPRVKRVIDWIDYHLLLKRSKGTVPDITEERAAHLKRILLTSVKQKCRKIKENSLLKEVGKISSGKIDFRSKVLVCENYDPLKEKAGCSEMNLKEELLKRRNIRIELEKVAVLGDPGQGKTRYLVDWVLDEIEDIETKIGISDNIPLAIPVFISLGSWSAARKLEMDEFDAWLADAFIKQYADVTGTKNKPGKVSIQALLKRSSLIPFLDGLDEVREDVRPFCLHSILGFQNELRSFVFSCRYHEFNRLLLQIRPGLQDEENERFEVYQLVRPATDYITGMVKETQQNADDILHFIDQSPVVLEYIDKPLYFNLFVLAFAKIKEKLGDSVTDAAFFERIMWEEYELYMFTEKLGLDQTKTPVFEQAKGRVLRNYLFELSTRLGNNVNVFFVEKLQPQWLKNGGAVFLYYLTSRIISGFFLSIAIGLFIAGPWDFISNGMAASFFVALLTMLLNVFEKKRKKIPLVIVVSLYGLVLALVTGIFQGFSVPRQNTGEYNDMINGVFSRTESLSGILLGLFYGIIFGYRKKFQSWLTDIRPVEPSVFSLRHAIRTGIRGGIIVGFFIAVAAFLVQGLIQAPTFNQWFESTIGGMVKSVEKNLGLNISNEFALIFLFPFVVGFYAGFLVFAIMGGRQKEIDKQLTSESKKETTETINIDPKFTLNEGIRRSLLSSLKYGFFVFIFVSVFYGLFVYMFTKSLEGVYRSLMIGLGVSIISNLWYGGFEFIQHWTLRILLYGYGILPLRFSSWVNEVQKLTFLLRVGHSLQFFHSKFKDYYVLRAAEEKTAFILNRNKEKKKKMRLVMACFFFFMVILLLMPLLFRFITLPGYCYYWKHPNEIYYKLDTAPVTIMGRATLKAKESCTLFFHVAGHVHVGTFTGNVTYKGTETGLLGFPLGNVYDIEPSKRHGALLFKNNQQRTWQHVDSLTYKEPDTTRPVTNLKVSLQKNEMMLFLVNDIEHQNNSGHFRVIVDSFHK